LLPARIERQTGTTACVALCPLADGFASSI
jgi:hypothetical protein